jgi:hypothetical protein
MTLLLYVMWCQHLKVQDTLCLKFITVNFHYKFSNKVKTAWTIIKNNSRNSQSYDDTVTKINSVQGMSLDNKENENAKNLNNKLTTPTKLNYH